jgi:hypothetical protein
MKHDAINLYSISRWLIKHFIAYVRRHPFFCGSLAVHAVVLYLLYSYGSYSIDLQLHQQAHMDVAQSVQKAQQADMQKRIDDMQKIKRLLEKSANGTAATEIAQSAKPQSLEDLLAKAKEVSAEIKTIEKNIKADELAKLLNIPREEALKKVEEKLATDKTKIPTQQETNAQAVKRLESEARSALEQRKKELDEKNAGIKVALTQAEKQNSDDKSEAKSGTGNQGKGQNGNADNQQSANQKGDGANGNGAHGNGGGSFAGSGSTKSKLEDDKSGSSEISEFLIDSSYAMATGNNFFDGSMGLIPVVRGDEKKQTARIIGAGGNFAERIYLNAWYIIGPFKGNSHGALYNNPSYPPEQLVDLDAVYFGKNERILKWQYLASGQYPFVPPDLAEDAVYYGYTEVALEHAQDLWMWCGADDDLQVWLNEHLVWAGGNIAKQSFFDTIYIGSSNYRKNWNLTEGKRLVHFQQGNNKLLFKLSNGPNRFGIFASIILTQ